MKHETKLEFVKCLDAMWNSFIDVTTPHDCPAVEKFLNAKGQAHALLAHNRGARARFETAGNKKIERRQYGQGINRDEGSLQRYCNAP